MLAAGSPSVSSLTFTDVQHGGDALPTPDVHGEWFTIEHSLTLAQGDARFPKPPITGKSEQPRPQLTVLQPSPP